jgi:hypothetical protein
VRVELFTCVIKFAREFALFDGQSLEFFPRQLVRFERKLELLETVFGSLYDRNCSGELQIGLRARVYWGFPVQDLGSSPDPNV